MLSPMAQFPWTGSIPGLCMSSFQMANIPLPRPSVTHVSCFHNTRSPLLWNPCPNNILCKIRLVRTGPQHQISYKSFRESFDDKHGSQIKAESLTEYHQDFRQEEQKKRMVLIRSEIPSCAEETVWIAKSAGCISKATLTHTFAPIISTEATKDTLYRYSWDLHFPLSKSLVLLK